MIFILGIFLCLGIIAYIANSIIQILPTIDDDWKIIINFICMTIIPSYNLVAGLSSIINLSNAGEYDAFYLQTVDYSTYFWETYNLNEGLKVLFNILYYNGPSK